MESLWSTAWSDSGYSTAEDNEWRALGSYSILNNYGTEGEGYETDGRVRAISLNNSVWYFG